MAALGKDEGRGGRPYAAIWPAHDALRKFREGWGFLDKHTIDVPSDLEGLKVRFPGEAGRILESAGASVQNLPGGEVYQALAAGAIDALNWLGPGANAW